jgi:hypothetical protein
MFDNNARLSCGFLRELYERLPHGAARLRSFTFPFRTMERTIPGVRGIQLQGQSGGELWKSIKDEDPAILTE